ncbi:MAG: hypothetical protein SCALA701_25780 [Candidatus Scalindua sp.]|nr:hypothetical protein [Planctomycetota bacterium]GJQ59777.1 MAG: hypothetical protein SCALA701_25780 [Candidatus Scalindua sp.]
MWTSKTVYTGIVTGVVAIAKAVGEATGAFVIPEGTVESMLGIMGVFLRMGIKKAEK